MSNRGDFGGELRDLRKDVERLRGDAAALFQSFIDAGRDQAGHVGGRFMRRAEEWVDELRSDMQQAKRRGNSQLSGLTDFVSAKPLLGIALGVGVGIALASLLNRRSA